MSRVSKFIKEVVLPKTVSKKRRKKILHDGLVATWNNDERKREAKEVTTRARTRARSSEDSED